MMTNKEGYDTSDFLAFVTRADLEGMASVGCNYTWTNGCICCKLDRALIYKKWLEFHIHSYVEFVVSVCGEAQLSKNHLCFISCGLDKVFQMGRQNTQFFHNLVKRNNKRNEIVAIQKSTGEIIASWNEVTAEFVEHF